MTNNFDKLRYIELLEKENFFSSNNKSLYTENKKEFEELMDDSIILSDQFYYNKKENYHFLMEDYQTKNIHVFEFVLEFFSLYKQDAKELEELMKNSQKLLSFEIDSRSENFSSLVSEIFENCDSLASDSNLKESYEISEDEFNNYFETLFFQMKQYFDK